MKKTNKENPLKFFNDNKAMAYKKAGGEMAAFRKSLKRMDNGGGSGMGRMASDDAAFEAMLNQPTSTPTSSPYPSSESARAKLAEAAYKANSMAMQNSNSKNVEAANLAYPTRGASIQSQTLSGVADIKSKAANTTPVIRKKGGSVKRKK